MLSRQLLSILFIALCFPLFGQESGKYRVHLADKEGVEFDPDAYFTDKAIERRKKHGIPLDHPSDRPLNSEYVRAVGKRVERISTRSRWFNLLYVRASLEQVSELQNLPFVERVSSVQSTSSRPASVAGEGDYDTISSERHHRMLEGQTADLGLKEFREHELDGEGIRVAVLDNGFKSVDENPAFEQIRNDGRIIGTRDFVQGDADVYGHGSHGTMVLSCIAGRTEDGKPIGLAPEAEFLLARTERSLWEPFSEEENWLKAMEWADRNGADIINSSLGYVYHRYFPEEMDGETSFISKAAKKAVDKGILVVNAAGNSGTNDWRIVGTPADVDSVLSIGGTNPNSELHTSFSSYGPTADKRMKPNLCAYGHVMASGPGGMTKTQGTSFASPLVAGFAACALQSDSSMRVSELYREMERSGSLYPYYDYVHGYGIPQAAHFTGNEKEAPELFRIERGEDSIRVRIDRSELREVIEERATDLELPDDLSTEVLLDSARAVTLDRSGVQQPLGELFGHPFLYYHIENAEGYLDEYTVIQVEQEVPLELEAGILEGEKKLRIHLLGVTKTIE